jgi:hypothetical protein
VSGLFGQGWEGITEKATTDGTDEEGKEKVKEAKINRETLWAWRMNLTQVRAR